MLARATPATTLTPLTRTPSTQARKPTDAAATAGVGGGVGATVPATVPVAGFGVLAVAVPAVAEGPRASEICVSSLRASVILAFAFGIWLAGEGGVGAATAAVVVVEVVVAEVVVVAGEVVAVAAGGAAGFGVGFCATGGGGGGGAR